MDDLISRQAALEKVRAMQTYKLFMGDDMILVDKAEVQTELMMLPSAQSNKNDQEFIKLTARYSNGRPYYSIIYLEYDKNGVGHDVVGYSSYSLDVISDYLKKYFMPPAQPEPQWIPVSERLPEVHESGNSVSGIYMQSNPVLVYGTCEYEDNAQFHVVTYCDDLDGNTYWSTELDAITVSGVIAWMPLPEAYKPNK